MKGLVTICRMVVGSLFIVSGLIKSNDALGFMYKLEEYFETGALNMEYLTPFALEIAVFVCVGEILLGVALLVGALPKLTSILTTSMMVFFTWLTWYTATCDPFGMKEIMGPDGVIISIANQCVLECGCFGNAIPLTPIQSFYKDVVLMIFVIPILIAAFRNKIALNDTKTSMIMYTGALVMTFLFGYLMLDWNFPTLYLILLLFAAEAVRKRVKSDKVEWLMAASALVVIGAFQYKTLAHLPMKDYRPYAEGQSIIENRKSAEELGFKGPVFSYEYIFTSNNSGEEIVITNWSSQVDSTFSSNHTYVTNKQVIIKEADSDYFEQPRIMDFQMVDQFSEDLTDSLLNIPGYTFLHISKDLELSESAGQTAFNTLAQSAIAEGHSFYGLTNVGYDESENFRHEYQVPYDFLTCDQTELKIVLRSNPGLILLKKGVVIEKWSWRDVPSFKEIKDRLNK